MLKYGTVNNFSPVTEDNLKRQCLLLQSESLSIIADSVATQTATGVSKEENDFKS